MRRKYFRSKAPVQTARKSREVVCTSGCISDAWPSHALTPQSSAVVTQLHTNCSFLLIPEGWKPASSLSAPGIEPGPPAHMSEHATEQLKQGAHVKYNWNKTETKFHAEVNQIVLFQFHFSSPHTWNNANLIVGLAATRLPIWAGAQNLASLAPILLEGLKPIAANTRLRTACD